MQLLRGGAGAGALLLAGAALSATFDHQEDGVLTYAALYGLAAGLVGAAAAITVTIERRKQAASARGLPGQRFRSNSARGAIQRSPRDATKPDSLALRLRQEVDKLSDLRSGVRSDPLGRAVMCPPPEYQIELAHAKQRIVSLLKSENEALAHEFLAEIHPHPLSSLIGGESESDRLARVMKVYVERLGRIIGRLPKAGPHLDLVERLTTRARRRDQGELFFRSDLPDFTGEQVRRDTLEGEPLEPVGEACAGFLAYPGPYEFRQGARRSRCIRVGQEPHIAHDRHGRAFHQRPDAEPCSS